MPAVEVKTGFQKAWSLETLLLAAWSTGASSASWLMGNNGLCQSHQGLSLPRPSSLAHCLLLILMSCINSLRSILGVDDAISRLILFRLFFFRRPN